MAMCKGSLTSAPNVMLSAGATSLIWRVDLPADGKPATARIWMEHDNMKNRPGEKKPEQPGVNGIRYAARTSYLYYTSTSQQLMMRVPVDPVTLDPAGLPEFVAGGRYWDDFVLDEDAGVAYVTTHRENTIDRVVMQADGNRRGFVIALAIHSPRHSWDRPAAFGEEVPATMAVSVISALMEEPHSRRTASCKPLRCCA